jgi:hypothetical protein
MKDLRKIRKQIQNMKDEDLKNNLLILQTIVKMLESEQKKRASNR